jgi:DNA-binding MarR family transcriptional regulator
MITAEPDITRLLARMKVLKLIKQQRDKNDRRVVWTQISAAGLDLLSKMDGEITQTPKDLLGHLDRKDLAELTRLLELARQSCGDTQAPVSCTGERCDRPTGNSR